MRSEEKLGWWFGGRICLVLEGEEGFRGSRAWITEKVQVGELRELNPEDFPQLASGVRRLKAGIGVVKVLRGPFSRRPVLWGSGKSTEVEIGSYLLVLHPVQAVDEL